IFCVYPERIYHTLFRFVISQRDTLPSWQYLLAFFILQRTARCQRMNILRHSLFLCLNMGKEGCFSMLRMDIVTERRIKMTYKEFEMQVKTYLEENLGADVTVSTYTARKNNQTLCQ